MKAAVGVAVVLSVVAVVFAGIEFFDDSAGDSGEYSEEQTLTLTGENERRVEFEETNTSDPNHPLEGFSIVRDVSGDATGEYAVTCLPLVEEHIECAGGFVLEDGEIEIEGTGVAEDDGNETHTIVGGTGAYHGAVGEFDVDWETDTFTLRYHVLEE